MRNPCLLVIVGLLVYGCFLGWLYTAPAGAQVIIKPAKPGQAIVLPAPPADPPKPGGPAKPDDEDEGFSDRVTLPRERDAERRVAMTREMAKEEDWSNAVKLLQSLLNMKEDVFLQNEKGRWVSVRTEANRIIGQMPREGQQFYEQQFGAEARKRLKQGMAGGDPQVYADVAQRFMHTEAGAEAAVHLGTYHLDHGRYIVAALCYERLLDREGQLEKLPATTLFKAAVAFERAGDTKNRDRAWTQLTQRLDNGDRLPGGLRRMDVGQLKGLLALKESNRATHERLNWTMFQGSPDRSALADGGAPFMAPRFKPIEMLTSNHPKEWVEKALQRHTTRTQAQLSGFHPIAVGGMLVFRSYWGVHAHDIKTGELKWKASGQMSLDYLAKELNRIDVNQQLTNWKNLYLQSTPSLFYDNSTLGTLSADNSRVYFVEDLAIPPHPSSAAGVPWRQGPTISGDLARWMEHNKLSAYHLQTGKLVWEIGTDQPDQPFSGAFFLGPPLVLGEKLYVLAEMGSGEIRLLSLELCKVSAPGEEPIEKAELSWSQTLCLVDRRLVEDPARRIQAAHLAYGDGVLVCPTNAGALLGVDLLTRSLVWAHSYHEGANDPTSKAGMKPMPGMAGYAVAQVSPSSWVSSAPIVRDGRVVFTAPDGESVRCLNLRDGTLLWREQRNNDIYLAGVFDGKVLLVGKDLVRALSFKDGKELWKVSTGLPAGRGVCNGQRYFLPLKSGEVWALDIAKGTVEGKSRAARQVEGMPPIVPGNLVFHDGEVISQSATHVAVFPQLAAKESAITQLLQKNPNDPRGLTERGDLRLNRGELAGAVADLRAALSQNDLPADLQRTARDRLYEALGDLLHKDFAANEGQLKDYQALVVMPPAPGETTEMIAKREEEERDRKARLFRIVAKGREEQGRMKEAVQAYLDFAKLGRKDLLTIPEEQATRALPEVWIQGRISDLLRRSKPEQKKALEDVFEAQWQAAQKADNLDGLERFANLFGPICTQGQQAKLMLAEKLVEQNQPESAQIKLWALTRQAEPEIAAKALDALARISTRAGELENAAYFYRLMAKKYSKVVIRDGKTGAEIYLDLATDKRFLPYLEEPRRGWMLLGPGESLKPENLFHQPQQQQMQAYTLEPEGDVPPFFRRHKLVIDTNASRFRMLDASSGTEQGSFTLRPEGRPQPYGQWVRYRPTYRVVSGLVVFAWGPYIYGYDPAKPKDYLWQQSLVNTADLMTPGPHGVPAQVAPNQNGQMLLVYADQTYERIGSLGPANSAQLVFLAREEGLVSIDPLQVGELKRPVRRWVRSDVPAGAEVFGDGEHLYIVLPGRDASSPGRGMCLRAIDGTPVEVRDFAAHYQRRLKTVGRGLLLREVEADGTSRLRLLDVHTGKDTWSRKTDPQAILIESHADDLTGFVEPDGQLVVLNTATGQETLTGKLDPSTLADKPEIRLLRDGAQIFIVFNVPVNPNLPQVNRRTVSTSFQLRTVAVNGPLYAFDRLTRQERWRRDVPPQALVLEQFEDMPILLFASSQRAWLAPPGAGAGQPPLPRDVNPVLALDKRDGFDGRGGASKGGADHVYSAERTGAGGYTMVKVEPRMGTIELFAYTFKVVFRLTSETARTEVPASQAAQPTPQPPPIQVLPQPGQIRLQLQRQQIEEVRRAMEAAEEARRQAEERRRKLLEKK